MKQEEYRSLLRCFRTICRVCPDRRVQLWAAYQAQEKNFVDGLEGLDELISESESRLSSILASGSKQRRDRVQDFLSVVAAWKPF